MKRAFPRKSQFFWVVTLVAISCGLTLGVCSVQAQQPSQATVSLSHGTGSPGSSVSVSLTMRGAPTVAGASFTVAYEPSALEAKVVNAAPRLSDRGLSLVSTLDTEGIIRIAIAGAKALPAGDGALCDLVFDVLPEAEKGNYPLYILRSTIVNASGSLVQMATEHSGIMIGGLLGDVDGDGDVTEADAHRALSSIANLADLSDNEVTAADLDGDGRITIADVVRIHLLLPGAIRMPAGERVGLRTNGQGNGQMSGQPTYSIPSMPGTVQIVSGSTASPPDIDGSLDDPVWQSAEIFDSFLQRDPVEGDPASERTEVRILHDVDRIYFGFRCFDSEPDRIVATRMKRDSQLGEDDNVSIILDTYNDRRGGFFFSTNPLGARHDMLLTDEGRARNEAWDCVWTCRTSRDAEGWTAEMAIDLDQLRYAESDDAVWGLNLGRTIRRKNEEVFFVPPPQEYGFQGEYRTSKIGTLAGLGELRTKPRLQIIPYTLGGTNREFDGLDPTEQPTLEGGVDLKYGLTPGLTLDLSYKTDFAQVEADQEQVNLTRFSLFFPELRDFFLEGAGIFDFGETVEFRGGSNLRPPTLAFYSRKIGIQDGHNIPVVFGNKLTGRAGAFEIGALHMMTEAGVFIDEDEKERFVTDTGLLLDEDEADIYTGSFVDTVDVDVIDTTEVKRTNFSVVRVRRDVLGRSNIGFIATNRDPGEDTNYNRVLGGDLNLSFFNAALKLKGFLAKSWSPDKIGDDYAGNAELEFRKYNMQIEAAYLDVQNNFNPEIGFVPRDDIRQYKGQARYRPRPGFKRIRQFSFGPRFRYVTDQNNMLQSSEIEASFFTNLEVGDWIGVRYRRRFERLDETFDVHEDIAIPIGDYTFESFSFNLYSSGGRRLSSRASYEFGKFFNGTRNRVSTGSTIKLSNRFTIQSRWSLNRVNLPNGNFATNSLGGRLLYSFSPDFFIRGQVQWNSAREVVGSNFLLNYRYAPGSDIFLVYNHAWNTEGTFKQFNRSIQLKVSYFWKK